MKKRVNFFIKRVYNIFRNQIFVIKEYIDEMLKKKYIKFNISLYVVFILIVKKLNEKLRIYVDYRVFNAFIIFNRNILLLIKKILAELCAIKIYNKFDIIIAFNKIKIKKNQKKRSRF